jgi:glucose-1-phosphate adenylyltransferase
VEVLMRTKAVILAGGEGNRLGVLTAKRAKPAVPFAGKYRIIDFPLSNCVNSGIFDVMILTQYRPQSLNDHIGAGQPWDLDRVFSGGVKLFQPYKGRADTDWYAGTADAIQQNFTFLKHGQPDYVLVLSGDHIYKMDYGGMIDFHARNQADLTIASISVPREEARRMGILATDQSYRVTQFIEKPKDPPSTLASMGVYVFSLPVLDQVLLGDFHDRKSSHDFGKDIIPRMIADEMRIFAYPFQGYWVDVGTLEAYWRTHMALLTSPSPIDLYDRRWVIHTRSAELPPSWVADGAVVKNSLVSGGTVIEAGARVERCVLSPGVVVGAGAVVRESVVLNGARIGAKAHVECAIIDKGTTIGAGARVGEPGAGAEPELVVVGKNATIPEGYSVPKGVSIGADVTAEELLRAAPLSAGASIERPRRVSRERVDENEKRRQ